MATTARIGASRPAAAAAPRLEFVAPERRAVRRAADAARDRGRCWPSSATRRPTPLWISFHRIDLIFKRNEFVGLAQLPGGADLAGASATRCKSPLHYTALVTIFALAIAVGGALVLNEKFRGRGFVMTVVILPWAVSLYATAIVWKYLYSPDWGMFNAILLKLNLVDEPVNFLSESLALPAVAVAHAWQIAPLGMYFVLATLQVIPEDLYKAAKVDRLGAFGRFRHVVFPYIKAPLLIVMVLVTVEAARAFDVIFFMTGGGPGDVSTTLTWEVYRVFYKNNQYGLGLGDRLAAGAF